MIPSGKLQKRIVIIAGPNGAGKTTFAREFLPNEADCPAFVNADLIAAGLSPFAPEVVSIKAGKLMLQAIHEHISKGESFAFETTLSGLGYSQLIPIWRENGYHVKIVFLKLPDVEMACARVAERVRQGGHNIPEAIIRRRFETGFKNFMDIYRTISDVWLMFDNSGEKPKLIDWGEK